MKQIKSKFYIEFISESCDKYDMGYSMQSKFFETSEEAIKWLESSFDFIGEDIGACLMRAEFTDENNYEIFQGKILKERR